ncbi:MAG: mandelate racemase/muconate lactonizing enzyme family protein [Pirellulales bacterium]
MKINNVVPYLLTTQLTDDPWFPNMLFSTAIVRVETVTGLDGLGEITQVCCCGKVVPPLVVYYKKTLLGKNALEITRLSQDMLDESVWWAHAGAACSVITGIEMSLWDLKGKALGVPAYQLLGGPMRESVPAYASGGPALWTFDETLRKVAHYAEIGYHATKLSPDFCIMWPASSTEAVNRVKWVKFSHARSIDEIVRGFGRLREEFGGDMDLMIDGHQGVETQPIPATEALEIADALAPFRLRFYEEPLAFTDLDGYRYLRERSRISIAAGENFNGSNRFHHWLSSGAVHLVQPDVRVVGGIHEAVSVIRHTQAFRVTTAIHTGASMGPSFAASWHIAVACPSVHWLERVPAAQSIQDDLLVDQFVIENGQVELPSSPELGVHLTEEHLRKYRFVPGAGERT